MNYLPSLKADFASATPLDANGDIPGLRRALKIAGIAAGLFFLIITVWGFVAPLSKAAIAAGVVQVEGRRKVVQHLEGGIIREILVRENDRVRKGQPLVRLDTVQSSAAASATRSEYLTLLAEAARLQAELSGAATMAMPADLAGASDPRAQEIIASQRAILETRRQSLNGQIQVLRETASQAQALIGGLEAQVASASSQLQLVRQDLATVRPLVAEQLERRSRLSDLERAEKAAEGQIGNLFAQINSARRQIAESNARVASLTSDRRDETVQKLRDVQLRLSEVQEKLRATSDIDARRTVLAPADGQIVAMHMVTIGGVVSPGQPILEIVPDRQDFVITTQVRPTDIENVLVGLPTEVRLLPYSGRTVPLLAGEVTAVAEDATIPEEGEPHYRVEVTIKDPEQLRDLDIRLLSGMPADVYIILGSRSMFDYLFQPLVDSFRRSFRES